MTITKSHLAVDGNSIRVSMPFAKVDEDKRLVSGWATMDNIDTQGDVVLAEASANAFARARGNIREMHQPIAAGRIVDFKEEEFYHNGEFYRGIFVTAYISKGAQDTWEKVLDGTLAGFSIGGEINEASNEFVKEANRTIRFIKDYDLTELSLVDNPANQLADVVSVQKNILSINRDENGAVMLKGMAVETKVENVFMCEKHDEPFITIKEAKEAACPECDTAMTNIGWFEQGGDRAEKVASVVSSYLSKNGGTPLSDEGGVEMSVKKDKSKDKEVGVVNPSEEHPDGEKIEESDETSVPVEDEEGADVDEVEGEEEESEAPEEVEDEATEISKKIDELHDVVKTSLAESTEQTLAKVTELEGKVEEAKNEFLAKASELEDKINGFGQKVEAQKVRLAELESNLEKVNRSGALKKSADYQPAEEIVQKETFWGGAFSD